MGASRGDNRVVTGLANRERAVLSCGASWWSPKRKLAIYQSAEKALDDLFLNKPCGVGQGNKPRNAPIARA